jgi:hypothetical protein
VVKVEDQNVAFIAVDARMLRQMLEHNATISFSVSKMQRVTSRVVYRGRFLVVFANIRMLTRLAIGAGKPILLTVKFVKRLRFFAARTTLHTAIVRICCASIMA